MQIKVKLVTVYEDCTLLFATMKWWSAVLKLEGIRAADNERSDRPTITLEKSMKWYLKTDESK